jgi:hypothetical protein
MKRKQNINKAVSIFLYVVALYYLLPFRPMYLYYSSQYQTSEVIINQNEANQADKAATFQTTLHHNKDTFPKKEKVRFFFDTGIAVSPCSITFIPNNKNERLHFLYTFYKDPFTLSNSSRGPPLA